VAWAERLFCPRSLPFLIQFEAIICAHAARGITSLISSQVASVGAKTAPQRNHAFEYAALQMENWKSGPGANLILSWRPTQNLYIPSR